jgi:molecular chaperone IbpA
MTYDFAPLFRSTIGFDRLARLVDTAAQAANTTSYPPYNIEKTGEDSYVLTMAVAGFGPEDIELTTQDNTLLVTGRVASEPKGEVLHRGIASRAFERRFALADHIVVESAELVHGLLHVGLKRVVPEALKPRRIEISTAPQMQSVANDKQIEGSAQAA